MSSDYVYHSDFWLEEPEEANPFAAKACYCHGYDVYGQIIEKASWFEYLLLMFKGDRPQPRETVFLEKIALVLANLGPKEASIRAAMNGGVAGTNHSSALMAALAVGSGQYGGSQELEICMRLWRECGQDLERWKARLQAPEQDERVDIWPAMEHPPGFDPNGDLIPTTVLQALEFLVKFAPDDGALSWLKKHRCDLEEFFSCPISITAITAAAFVDLGLDQDQGSMLYLILRLPGAAVHALEQRKMGWKKFPFYSPAIELEDDPGPVQKKGVEDQS
ncbi:citryl-CoA lyase [Marinobacter sp. F3R08]|uniref:citryl-CoA lyase n=1 Tax=Marinobacter sp. F3R08 TaxID=2841559 RepID=UPI001C09824D|nr:citryl-CoA lyase [Marinobacter sp. F3R08]MBU2955805.1 citryl-CoA lyase [Marinobacter sp. F3R08]